MLWSKFTAVIKSVLNMRSFYINVLNIVICRYNASKVLTVTVCHWRKKRRCRRMGVRTGGSCDLSGGTQRL